VTKSHDAKTLLQTAVSQLQKERTRLEIAVTKVIGTGLPLRYLQNIKRDL
jgi:hypothetical protein